MLRDSKCFGNNEVIVRSTCCCFSACCKCDVNVQEWCESALGENWKEPSSSTASAEASFDDDSNKEALNVNKVLSAIIEKY